MTYMKKLLLLFLLTAFPVSGFAKDVLNTPRWSFELKGGYFEPALERWAEFYGEDRMSQFNLLLAYKLTRFLDIGFETGYRRDSGKGYLEVSSTLGGEVDYENYPVGLFAVIRGVFSEDQWLVPYMGGGFGRIYYKTAIEYQDSVRGAVNGYNARVGVQLLLDVFDKSLANSSRKDYGLHNTYLTLEIQKSRVRGSVDLGGSHYLAGLLFEF